jgi:hypothetical protein
MSTFPTPTRRDFLVARQPVRRHGALNVFPGVPCISTSGAP